MRNYKLSILALFSILLVFACERDVIESEEKDDPTDGNSEYVEKEIDNTWDSISSTTIELLGSDVDITGEGAVFESNQITISEGGQYLVTGTLDNGKIKIAADELDTVKLMLDNVSLTSYDNACIYAKTAAYVILILNEASENSLTDISTYTNEEQNAVVYAKTDLAITGEGSLTIEANYKDGITSKDGLVITSGSYEVNAADDGIRGKDYLVIEGGNYSITSGGDAIKSDNEDVGFGNITINTGVFAITSNADGIAAKGDLTIKDGTFTITTNNDDTSVSTKALKAGSSLDIDDGSYIIESDDNAIHSEYDITINEGTFSIDTDNDGIHADNEIIIENADITINSSAEGIEAGYITVNDGTIKVNASDDGFNATQGTEVMSDDGSQLTINGGDITINMSGNDVDALDSNGDITINGGTINLNIPTQGVAEALDANGSIEIADAATVYENGEIYTESNSGPGR